MNKENNEMKVEIISQDSLSTIIKSEIDVAISTAKAYPRSLTEFMRKTESMATLNEEIAASCSYALPRAGKALEGPSVRLAEMACANYGNIRAGARVISNDGKHITAQGVCHDLETNNFVSVEVKRKITDKNGKTYSEDMQTVTGNAACAIAYRNAVFKVIPAALINGIYEKSKEVARGTAETLVARRKKCIDYFKSINVSEKMICDALGIKNVDDINLDMLFTLTGFRSAIKNGEATVDSLFSASLTIELEDLRTLYELKKDAVPAEEQPHIERILDKNESRSFAKVHKYLINL